MPKKIDESKLAQYADEMEGRPAQATTYDLKFGDEEATQAPTSTPTQSAEDRLRAARPQQETLEEAQTKRKQEIMTEIHSNGLGYIRLNLADLPTKGIFYPDGTEIFIRAAIGGEIRHWSQFNETEMTEIDDALNYMLERCTSIRMPNRLADWKDLVDVDRLYIILRVRDFTFPDGNNELMIRLSETKQIPLKNDNIDYIKIEDNIMKFYNPNLKCFTIKDFKAKNGRDISLRKPLNIYMPKLGVVKWLKDYAIRKRNLQENFDEDFIKMAHILIPDYRGLSDEKYTALIQSYDWLGPTEYSLIERFKRVIKASINPRFKYVDEQGVEQTAPMQFQGGIKALFLLGDMDDLI